MRKILSIFTCLVMSYVAFGQTTAEYNLLVKKADSLYEAKDYLNSANTYSAAFKANGWKARPLDRYNAACSWALANNLDSAFFQLNRVTIKSKFSAYDHVMKDTDLDGLHSDKRWLPVTELIRQNKEAEEANYNKQLVSELNIIREDDQKYRKQLKEIEQKYGRESNEMKAQWVHIIKMDSVNLAKVKAIIHKYGWVSKDTIGTTGSTTLALIIQHSDLATQEKYLPILREAVKKKAANGGDLAFMEDYVALQKGKKQIYGSQVGKDLKTGLHYVCPLEDPENVDKRRTEVGIISMEEYLVRWDLKWDVAQYKKDLPAIEAIDKK